MPLPAWSVEAVLASFCGAPKTMDLGSRYRERHCRVRFGRRGLAPSLAPFVSMICKANWRRMEGNCLPALLCCLAQWHLLWYQAKRKAEGQAS